MKDDDPRKTIFLENFGGKILVDVMGPCVMLSLVNHADSKVAFRMLEAEDVKALMEKLQRALEEI